MNISSCAHTVHGKRNELGKTTSRYRPRRGRKFDPGTARAPESASARYQALPWKAYCLLCVTVEKTWWFALRMTPHNRDLR